MGGQFALTTVTIQFLVIAAGSQRVAEVAARFTLDAMPGKQMAIDADLHAGILDASTARRKRDDVQREADFYGAMDGAGKFVKGDAIAAIVIVALNLVGGVIVGVAYDGLSPLQALNTFALLTIGNALVTTLPAFLISTAMGMMVTRVASEGALGSDLATQLLARPEILRMSGALLLALGFVPALPHVVFWALGLCALAMAQIASRHQAQRSLVRTGIEREAKRRAMRRPELALTLVGVDALSLEFGSDLAAMLASPMSDALLDRVGEVRRAVATEIGVVIPGVRVRDDGTRDPASYAIRVRDRIVASGHLQLHSQLAVGEEDSLHRLGFAVDREPVYGLPAAWIAPNDRERAVNAGCLVFDPVSVIGSHLAEVARVHAHELLGRQEFATLVEHLRASVPALVKDIGDLLAPMHRAFTLLLREQVWPRDPVALMECMLESGFRDAASLAEVARRIAVPALLRSRERIAPLVLDPVFERALLATWSEGGQPEPDVAMRLREAMAAHAASHAPQVATVLCTGSLRPLLAEFGLKSGLRLEILAYVEIPPEISVRPERKFCES
ncbi:MAG: FHIPEP family type III secretion protein [Vulcanimicrobiaceae bacterium]